MHEPHPPSPMRDVFRVLFLLPVDAERLQVSWGAVLAAALATVAVPSLFGLTVFAGEGRFALEMVPHALTAFSLSVLLAIVLAGTTQRPGMLPAFLFTTLAAWAILDAASLVLWEAVRGATAERVPPALQDALWLGPLVWLALAIGRFAWRAHEAPSSRRLSSALAALLVAAIPFAYINPERSLWVKDWSRERNDTTAAHWLAAGHERAIYAQPGLLTSALEAVKPGRPGVVDVFFVGLAGYGRQDVFMREVEAVTRLMEERFDAAGRTVSLVNNPKTVLDTPIANLTSLQATLRRVKERMNGDEDVLVLFLTSHGSEDHHFALDLPPLQFNRLDPAALKRLLDESGIRNRVVIVSACYSGGFASPLADPHTLVLTASAPDRNSFGCSNEAEWTYFGRAYFDEALRATHSFTRAFEQAVPLIAAREAAEKHTPSNPLMRGGEALASTLQRLEARLGPLTRTASTGQAKGLR
jgi:hypothetical protein